MVANITSIQMIFSEVMIVCKNIFTRNFKIYFPKGKLVSVIIYLWYLTTKDWGLLTSIFLSVE